MTPDYLSDSLALQILNGYLVSLGVCAMIIFGHYLYKHYHEGYTYLRPAIAMMVLWIGLVVMRGPLFHARTLVNGGFPTKEPLWFLTVGGMIMVTALLCIIRVFSPAHWGNKSWIAALIASSTVVGISLLYVWM